MAIDVNVVVLNLISKWVSDGEDLLGKYGLHAVYVFCALRRMYYSSVELVFGKKNKTQDFVWVKYGSLTIDTEEFFKAAQGFSIDSNATYEASSDMSNDFKMKLSNIIRTNKKL